MQRQQPGGTFDEMAAWLLELERRLRLLEAENQDLRRQLTDLRRGVGIALVIEGRTVPVAPLSPISAPTGPVPAVAPPTGAGVPPFHAAHLPPPSFTPPSSTSWPGITPAQSGAEHPSSGALPIPANDSAAMARSWPAASGPMDSPPLSDPLLPAQREHVSTQPRADQRPSWPPAETTAHLPVVRPLSAPLSAEPRSEPHAAWLRTGSQWPDQAPPQSTQPHAPPTTPAHAAPLPPLGQHPAPQPGEPALPDPAQRERQPGERNPFADSFIL